MSTSSVFGLTVTTSQALEFTFATIDVPGATQTFADGINPRGDIVGSYSAGGTGSHGFLLHRGTFTTIDVPGATDTLATGINPRRDIVGFYFGEGVHGFLLHEGTFTTIDVPGGTLALSPGRPALGMNSRGDIVGSYVDGAGAAPWVSSCQSRRVSFWPTSQRLRTSARNADSGRMLDDAAEQGEKK